MEFKKLKIAELRPALYNPRKDLQPGNDEYEKIKNSILEFGYIEPVIVNNDMTVISGHQRLKVLRELGFNEIDCVVIEVDKTQEKALNVALNRITGEWDMPALAKLLDELRVDDYDFTLSGFDLSEAEKLWDEYLEDKPIDTLQDDDFDIELPEEPISKLGDLWLLGKHRLYCGDSTSENDVGILMGGDKADLVFSDPPWNVNYGGSNHPSWKQRTILNDCMSTEEFKEFMNSTFKIMNQFSKCGCMTYIVMSAQEWGSLMLALRENDYHWSSTIIWNKDSLVLSRKDYHTKYEPIWYGWKDGESRLHPLEDRKQSDVWDIPRPKVSELHPNCKPVELVIRAIKNSSNMKDTVLDLFGGSGSTLIACEGTERICRMMELDPKYCDVIVQRYIDKVGSSDEVFLLRGKEKIPFEKVKK